MQERAHGRIGLSDDELHELKRFATNTDAEARGGRSPWDLVTELCKLLNFHTAYNRWSGERQDIIDQWLVVSQLTISEIIRSQLECV